MSQPVALLVSQLYTRPARNCAGLGMCGGSSFSVTRRPCPDRFIILRSICYDSRVTGRYKNYCFSREWRV